MQNERRWMASILSETEQTATAMPWQRGARRAEWLERNPLRDGSTRADAGFACPAAQAEA